MYFCIFIELFFISTTCVVKMIAKLQKIYVYVHSNISIPHTNFKGNISNVCIVYSVVFFLVLYFHKFNNVKIFLKTPKV